MTKWIGDLWGSYYFIWRYFYLIDVILERIADEKMNIKMV
jgi:hypothetical protein